MKKNLILITILGLASIAHAQEKINRWEVGTGIAFGLYAGNYEITIMNASINLEGEYYSSKLLSVYGHIDYNRSFATNEGTGSVGYATTHIGPRLHITKTFFAGAGVGAAFYANQDARNLYFSYNPHVGAIIDKTELTFGYKAWTSENITTGFWELGVVLKMHRVKN